MICFYFEHAHVKLWSVSNVFNLTFQEKTVNIILEAISFQIVEHFLYIVHQINHPSYNFLRLVSILQPFKSFRSFIVIKEEQFSLPLSDYIWQ